jgi:ParB/RepB/Spo0J family partition protein
MEKIDLNNANLGSLDLPDITKSTVANFIGTDETFIKIPVEAIEVESNIRTKYDEDNLNSLALSMKQYGQLEPIRVYENKETLKYFIIFGHRRFFAAKKIDPETNQPYLRELKCLVTAKPDSLDNLYLQAIENEHSVNISSTDREAYINILKTTYKQTVHEIARKLGKNVSWIYRILEADKLREKYKDIFTKFGFIMNTRDVLSFYNASDEEVIATVNAIIKNPRKKTIILNNLRIRNKKKKGSNTVNLEDKSLQKEFIGNLESFSNEESNNVPFDYEENESSTKNNFHFEILIKINDVKRMFNIKSSYSGYNIDINAINIVYEKAKNYFENKGYLFVDKQ